MGSKTRAREIMQEAGVPIVPGSTEPSPDVKAALKTAKEIGYPVACKAAGGGGGKGFRVATSEDELADAFEGAAREGEKFFSDDRVYLERYLEDPRHVEVQVLADSHGNVIHLGERDCSIQRRHQKLIEEAPGPLVDDEMRERIGKIATDAAAAVDYRGAGTVEGMQVGEDYFFLEMNTRVQVEHCVTEMVTGIDIVREQVRIAAGEPLSIAQDDVELRGHAIECRINAEAAHKNFAPAPGPIETYIEPAGPGRAGRLGARGRRRGHAALRPDGREADRVGRRTAQAATKRMLRALGEYRIEPLTTLIPFHQAVMASDGLGRGVDVPRRDRRQEVAEDAGAGGAAGAEGRRRGGAEDRADLPGRGQRAPSLRQGDRRGRARRRTRPRRSAPRSGSAPAGGGGGASGPELPSPLQGTIFKVARREGPGRGRGRPGVRDRGDEDGERDHRPPGGQDRGDQRGRGGLREPGRRPRGD